MQILVIGLHETGHDHFHLYEFTVNIYSVIHRHLTYAYSKAGTTRLHKLRALQSWLRWFQDNGTADKQFSARANKTYTKAPAIKKKVFPYSESSEVPGQRWTLIWQMAVIMCCMVTHIPHLCRGEWIRRARGIHSNLRGQLGGGGGTPNVIFFKLNTAWKCP
jgi:hypothetical protein